MSALVLASRGEGGCLPSSLCSSSVPALVVLDRDEAAIADKAQVECELAWKGTSTAPLLTRLICCACAIQSVMAIAGHRESPGRPWCDVRRRAVGCEEQSWALSTSIRQARCREPTRR